MQISIMRGLQFKTVSDPDVSHGGKQAQNPMALQIKWFSILCELLCIPTIR